MLLRTLPSSHSVKNDGGEKSANQVLQLNALQARGESGLEADLGIALIQEPWVNRGCLVGLSSKDIKVIWDAREEK